MSRARDIANYGDGIDTSSITSGTFADARIAVSNVTQHEGSIDALASNPTITLGTNTRLPQGSIANVHCSSPSSVSEQTIANSEATVLTGSSVSYTPATGARYVVYEYRCQVADKSPSNALWSGKLQLNDSGTYRDFIQRVWGGRFYSGELGTSSIVTVAIDLANLDTYFNSISSSHDWKTKAGGTSAFSANTLRVIGGQYSGSFTVGLHQIYNTAGGGGSSNVSPTTIIYSVM